MMQATRRGRVLALLAPIALTCLALVVSRPVPGVESNEPDSVRINGVAHRVAANPDDQSPPSTTHYEGRVLPRNARISDLEPLPARNPDRATWLDSVRRRARHLAEDDIPANIQVSREGDTQGASRPVTDFSEVMLAVDLADPDHLLGCSKFFYQPDRYRFYTGVFESFDGGLTWDQEQPEGLEQYSLTSDPVATFDNAGSGYFTLLTRRPTGLDMLRKPPGGGWMEPVVVDRSTVTDKQWIAGDQDPLGLSPHAGNLYMSWTAIGSEQRPSRIAFSRSIDTNESWSSPPVYLTEGSVQGSVPGVAPDGTVYVAYGRDIFGGGVVGSMEVASSHDGGQTFGAPVRVAQSVAVPYLLPNAQFRTPGSMPGFAVSPATGALFVAWADYSAGDADILLSRSLDGGETWQRPVRLNDDPEQNGVDQFQPQVAVAPNGRVSVIWFDRRLPCPDLDWIPRDHVDRENFCIDTFITRSYDEGETWEPNRRVSAQTWDWSVNLPWVNEGIGFIGDYQGLAASDDFDFPFWNATANLGDNPDNRQQIFVARVPGEPLPTVTPSATRTPEATATASATATKSVEPTASATPTSTLADEIHLPMAEKPPAP